MTAALLVVPSPKEHGERLLRFQVNEEGISRALESFTSAGMCLALIRRERLYEIAGFECFDAYCEKRWGFTKRRANQLISAAAAADRLVENNCSRPPENEAQARELSRLPDDEQVAAWSEVVETAPDGTITARHVADVVTKRLPKREPKSRKRVRKPQTHYRCGGCNAKIEIRKTCEACFDEKQEALEVVSWVDSAVKRWPASRPKAALIAALEAKLAELKGTST